MAERRRPERETGHEQDIDNDGHEQAREGNPDRHASLAGKLVPHGNIEKHAEEHVRKEHDRNDAHAGAEVLSYYQCKYVEIEKYSEKDESAECRKVFHNNGIELSGAFVLCPLEEERLGSETEHLDEQVHYHGQFHSRLEDAETRPPRLSIGVQITEQNPVQEVIDDAGKGSHHQRNGVCQHLTEEFAVKLE